MSADRSAGRNTGNVRFSILEKCRKAAPRYRPFALSDGTRLFSAAGDGNGVDLSFYRAINCDVNRRKKQFRGAVGRS